jgi:hypothetical protein
MTLRIAFSIDGGFASLPGLRKPVEIDGERLPAAQAARLRELVERARFFSAAAPPATDAARDARAYTVEIDDGERCRKLTLAEPIADATLRELVSEIRACARNLRSR